MAKFHGEQYFHVSLSPLRLGKALPFTLHIYLPVNDRIVPLILSDEVYEQRTADLLARRKISEVYILVSDRAVYEEYMQAEGMIPEPMEVGVQAVHAPEGAQHTPPEAAIEEPKTPQARQDASAPTTPPTTATTATATAAPAGTTATAADVTDTSPTENKSAETVTPIEVVATGVAPVHTQDTQAKPAIEAPKTPQARQDPAAIEEPSRSTQHTQAASVPTAPTATATTAPVRAQVPEAASQDIAAQPARGSGRADPARAPRTSQQSSRRLASEIFGEDPGASERALSTSRKIIRKLLDGATEEEKKLFDVFAALDAAGKQGYSSSVASYCVLFAMGIGYSDVETLRDLAVASLLHDIGTTQLPPETVWTPRNQQTPGQRREFAEHVRLGKNLLEALAFKPNARVAALIEAHHEKFDGTGYPNGIRGEKLTELSQVLSFSDFLHSLSTGYFDGKKRSPHESFAYLREIENDPRFPHYFNPILFRKIVEWVRAGSPGKPPLAAAS